MNQEQMIRALKGKGAHVIGTTKEFDCEMSENGIWISAESTPNLFNYDSERWLDTFGVQPELNAFVEENGWYFEWYDAGTMMVWVN